MRYIQNTIYRGREEERNGKVGGNKGNFNSVAAKISLMVCAQQSCGEPRNNLWTAKLHKSQSRKKNTVSTNHKSACRLLVIRTIIDALLEGCTEGVWLLANAVEGAGSVDTSPVPTVGGILTLIHI